MVPPFPLSNAKTIYFGGIVAGITVGVMYALTLVVGYPLPFGMVAVSPVCILLLLAPLLSWMKKARADRAVWAMGVNMVKILACEESLVLIYPTYFLFFTTIPDSAKAAFSPLLPVIKIILRGVLARTAAHREDEIPQIVVINVDLFSALFSTYCMQITPSVKTTGVFMAAKAIQMSISLYDIEQVVQRMKVLRKQSDVMKVMTVQGNPRNSIMNANAEAQREQSDSRVSSSPLFALIHASTRKMSRRIQPFNQINVKPRKTHGLLETIAPLLAEINDDDQRGPSKAGTADAAASNSVKYQYVGELREVLYITEFVTLVNYVEVVIPLIFSAYLFALYHLPNRVYYELMDDMDDNRLHNALANVLLYAALQFASLLVLNIVLWQRLQI
ncbi:hypothetical protein PF002_g20959 [Phytophthora fragariae]|uniref:Uncharacterized protein n=1 Tax=Phytophthora fragariae TaxID=53985 RepID=A0A6A3SJ80_9STRA|nr:hypothetical protein PF003_g31988 [Phytophthora fragariae]KAE9117962.1 hypothetical protein PF006_g18702 [Phytophthora fragariae]KAE9203328.1 hypothetical protein PF002_g20959 [Phytophthora fragariae]KAE9284854.1 hypothetical protein PF001_g22175 [Phytophthora fragariae]